MKVQLLEVVQITFFIDDNGLMTAILEFFICEPIMQVASLEKLYKIFERC
jgi:hypothetical protein